VFLSVGPGRCAGADAAGVILPKEGVVCSRLVFSFLPLLVATAAILAFTRVYLGVHYVGDVLAGLLLGLVFGGLYVWLVPAPF